MYYGAIMVVIIDDVFFSQAIDVLQKKKSALCAATAAIVSLEVTYLYLHLCMNMLRLVCVYVHVP